jgi:hypothetical protein
MTSTRVRLTVVLAAGLALSGCVGNESGTTSLNAGLTSTSSVATTFPTTRDQEKRVISETLNLQAGTGDPATFEFQALVPIENAFDVRINMPSGTELDIKFVTENDMTLQIFDPVKAESFCLDEDGRTQCLLHYPALEAPTPGTWTAIVNKISTPPAEVTITIEWLPVDQGSNESCSAAAKPAPDRQI